MQTMHGGLRIYPHELHYDAHAILRHGIPLNTSDAPCCSVLVEADDLARPFPLASVRAIADMHTATEASAPVAGTTAEAASKLYWLQEDPAYTRPKARTINELKRG